VRSMPNSATNGLASPAVLVICPASALAEGSSSWKRSAPHRGYLSGFCTYLGSGRTKALGTSLIAAALVWAQSPDEGWWAGCGWGIPSSRVLV
jgi:hypothetical protein